MNTELKTKLITALRSGKYQHGEGHLRTKKGKFCCLGVLCDIYSPEKWEDAKSKTGMSFVYCQEGLVGTLYDELKEKSGISDEIQDTLMKMHDKDDASFSEIADWIEQNL